MGANFLELSCSAAAAAAAAKSLQLCPTLCDPIDSSSPGSPVPGIFQARVLEWDAIAFSEDGSSNTKFYLMSFETILLDTDIWQIGLHLK